MRVETTVEAKLYPAGKGLQFRHGGVDGCHVVPERFLAEQVGPAPDHAQQLFHVHGRRRDNKKRIEILRIQGIIQRQPSDSEIVRQPPGTPGIYVAQAQLRQVGMPESRLSVQPAHIAASGKADPEPPIFIRGHGAGSGQNPGRDPRAGRKYAGIRSWPWRGTVLSAGPVRPR